MKRIALYLTILVMFTACHKPPPPPPPPPCPDGQVRNEAGECVCPEERPDWMPELGGCVPPRYDRPVDFGVARGVTAFCLTVPPPGMNDLKHAVYIFDFVHHIHRFGHVVRVGAQTDGWTDFGPERPGYLRAGPAPGTRAWRANLIRMLEVTARVRDTWVQLIPSFTHKQRDQGSPQKNIDYFNDLFDQVHEIVRAGNYKHVFYEAFNEPVHPLSQHLKDEDVREIILHMNRAGRPNGVDYHGGTMQVEDAELKTMFAEMSLTPTEPFWGSFDASGLTWRGRYPYIWRDIVSYIAFHTPRNPTPTLEEMRAAQDKYRYVKPVLIDETVAWASDANIAKYRLIGKGTIAMQGRGTENERMWQVVKHLRDIHRMGWKPFYHAIWLIECVELGRIPDYDKDIKTE